jgi:hypothetical protein
MGIIAKTDEKNIQISECPQDVDYLVEEFANAYCKCLDEKGYYKSLDECMKGEGHSIAKQLRANPKQGIFTSQDGISCSCVRTRWGDPFKSYDKQYRWPTQYGEIHSLCPKEGDCITHRDIFKPSNPLGHIIFDYIPSSFEEEKTINPVEWEEYR